MRTSFLASFLLTFACYLQLASTKTHADVFAFDSADDLKRLQITGDSAIEEGNGRTGGALRLAPGSKAILRLRDTDGSGKVEIWVNDDMTVAEKPKENRAGPRWGIVQGDGQMLVMGVLYARYLGGDTTYATSEGDGKAPLSKVQYSAIKRSEGWHKWTFDFDPDKGLSITRDDKQKARFDWNQTQMKGFTGVVLLGDEKGGKEQTLLVDNVSVTLGDAMKAQPVAPPPPPPVTPEKDPAPENIVKLVPAVSGKHPRLLFTADDVQRMRTVATGDGKAFNEQLLKYLPACTPPTDAKYLTDATDGQRQGLWKLPTVALHYVLTGDKASLDKSTEFLKRLLAQKNWETGKETDSGMSAANIMIGAALAYDWLYNDLDPAFREEVRQRLLLQARRMYHGGHMMKNPGPHYWQGDPHNNHRWHRNAGMTLCILAVADESKGEADWLLSKTLEELKLIHQWLPEDGSTHESPSYMVFGAPYLVFAFDAADRCLGSELLKHNFFKTTVMYRLATTAPGFGEAFTYGDGGGYGFYNNYNFRCTAVHKLADEQEGVLALYGAQPGAFGYAWMSIVWFDPTIKGGSLDKIAKRSLFDDVGVAFLRDGWSKNDVAAMFKCGPYGGSLLNKYRNDNNYKYINIAHDDPDANMFVLYARGDFVAENDRYAQHKLTSSHNTILVNGKGQKGEGAHWTQPLRGADQDMTRLAKITAWHDGGDDGVSVVEGEAGRSYVGLDSYRRTMAWSPKGYVLLLDSINAPQPQTITWLMQSPQVTQSDDEGFRFLLKNGSAECALHYASSAKMKPSVADSTAEDRGKPLGYKQVRLEAQSDKLRIASVFDAWNKGDLKVSMSGGDNGAINIKVSGKGIDDTWTWKPATDEAGKTELAGKGFTLQSRP